MPFETLNLSDGTTISMERPSDLTDAQWKEYKDWYETNPEDAYEADRMTKDADMQRDSMILQVMTEYYYSKIDMNDSVITEKLEGLTMDREFKSVFADIESNPNAGWKYSNSEPLMMKISKKMGGIPPELKPALNNLRKTPMTFHEACKMGATTSVANFVKSDSVLDQPDGIDGKDHKGITALAYAIGANRTEIVKLLLEKKANPAVCDTKGNSGIHYAAGYGRKDIIDLLVKAGASKTAANKDGKTPADVASQNNQAAP